MNNSIISRCEAKGLRMTGQRRVIAQALEDSDDHPDVEELYARASAIDSGISGTWSDVGFQIDENIKRLKILTNFDRVEITPEVLERDWCWISVKYGMGTQWISLSDILAAKRAKQRYVATV